MSTSCIDRGQRLTPAAGRFLGPVQTHRRTVVTSALEEVHQRLLVGQKRKVSWLRFIRHLRLLKRDW